MSLTTSNNVSIYLLDANLDMWCADVSDGITYVPYSSFRADCHNETPGPVYAGEPVAAVMAGIIDLGPVDLCVNYAVDTTR